MIWSDKIFYTCRVFFFILHFQGHQGNPDFFHYFYDFFQIFCYLMRSSSIFRPISFLGNFDVPGIACTLFWSFLDCIWYLLFLDTHIYTVVPCNPWFQYKYPFPKKEMIDADPITSFHLFPSFVISFTPLCEAIYYFFSCFFN